MFFVDAFIAIRTVHVCVCSMRLTTSFRYSYNFCCVIHIAVPFSVLVFLKFANCVQCTQIFHSFSLSRSLIHFLCSVFAVWITKFCHLRSPFCLSTVQHFCSISWFVLYLLSQVAYLYVFFVCLFCSWFSVGQTFLIATKISCLSK